jgi:hypothetical protein
MRRTITITVNTDDVAENSGFDTLMDNLKECCLEQANELIAMDALEHGYYFSVYDPSRNNVSVDASWDECNRPKK